MSLKSIPLFFMLLILMLVSAGSIAENKAIGEQELQLVVTDDIKALLIQEMLAIEKGMKELVTSISRGKWHKTVEVARQIQASYILKQGLTKEQMQYMHSRLPEQFVQLDHSFHQYAGMLAHAAEVKNADVVNFYFYKMNESCIQCHSRYAQAKFSGFSKASPQEYKN